MEVSSAKLIDLAVDDVLPDREVHLHCGIDSAFLHFAGAILEYSPPDRVIPYSKKRGESPMPRPERVRLVSARLFDLETKTANVVYDTEGGGIRMEVKPHPPKRHNEFELASMAQACGMLMSGWKALFASAEPPIPLVVENPKKQAAAGGGWNGPPAQFAISAVPFAIVGALDKSKGLPHRFVEYRQAKADVKRGTAYTVHKEDAIERTKQIMKKNNDVGGLELLEEMENAEWKTDDVADAYLLALKSSRRACKVTTAWLTRVKERICAADGVEEQEETPTTTPTKKRKRKEKDTDGRETKRAKKE